MSDGPEPGEPTAIHPDPLRWWPTLNRDGWPRVFCAAPAGAGADYFRPLARAVDGRFTVHGLRLPGRERRLDEKPLVAVGDVVASVAAAAAARCGDEYTAIGVCSGSRLAWRTVHALDRRGIGPARMLVILDARPPGDEAAYDRVRRLDRAAIVRHLAGSGATPLELLEDEEFSEYAVRAYRADLCVAAEPLSQVGRISAPIVEVVTGSAPASSGESGWAAMTTADARLMARPGAARADRPELLRLARELLAA